MVMVYFCRHAIAEDARKGMSDADRALTAEGAKKFRKAADGMVKLVGATAISHVVSSPLLRARQTAEILTELLAAARRDVPLTISDTLGPGGDLKGFLKMVRTLKGATGVVAVGHEPVLGLWLGELCFGRVGRVRFKKGAVAGVELEATGARGEMMWLMQPGMLREL